MTTTNSFARKQGFGFNGSKSYSGAPKKAFSPNASDHIIKIKKIDLENSCIYATNHMGIEACYSVNPEKSKFKKAFAKDDKFSGGQIDARMVRDLKPGRTVVVEGAKWFTNGKDQSGVEVKKYHFNWLHNAPQKQGKLIRGIVTAQAKKDGESMRAHVIQVWDEKSVSLSNKDEMKTFQDKLNQVLEDMKTDPHANRLGYQFRAMLKPRPGSDETYTVIDSSTPFDAKKIQGEEDNKAVYAPLSGEQFASDAAKYVQYVKDTFPGMDLELDAMTFKSYLGGRHSKGLILEKEWMNISKMCNTAVKASTASEGEYMGKNMSVRGIVCLTDDSYDKDTQITTTQNLVKNVFATGAIYDVRSAVKAAGDQRVSVHEDIKGKLPKKEYKDLSTPTGEMTSVAKGMLKEAEGWDDEEDPFSIQ